MRRDGGIKTYGRHRNRVIVSDVWLSDSDGKNIFGTSSENDSSKHSSIFHVSSSSSEHNSLSLNSTGNLTDPSFGKNANKRLTRQNQRNEKENRACGKKGVRRSTRQVNLSNKTSLLSIQDTGSKGKTSRSHLSREISDISHSFNNKSERIPLPETQNKSCRVLWSRAETNCSSDSSNCQKQLRSATAKRKRLVKKTNNNGKATTNKEVSVNFSDFDDYSLVIQDTSRGLKEGISCVETSTPVAKRTCKPPYPPIKPSDISHIDIVISPSSDTCYTSLETPYSIHSKDDFSNITDDIHCSPSLLQVPRKSTRHVNGTTSLSSSKAELKTPGSIVLLEKLSDSFIERHTHSGGSDRKKASRNVANDLDGSDCLFSTPGTKCEDNIKFLTSKIQQLSFIEHVSDYSEEEEEEEAEEEEEDEEEYEEEEEESGEQIEDESEVEAGIVEKLDILLEEDEYSTDQEESEEDDLSKSWSNQRVTRNTRQTGHTTKPRDSDQDDANDVSGVDGLGDTTGSAGSDEDEQVSSEGCKDVFKLNVKRLNQSLQNNQISLRNRGGRRNKVILVTDDLEESVSSSGVETSESGASLYMINENFQDNGDDKSNGSVDLFSNSSIYDTARSADIRHSQGDQDGESDDDESNVSDERDDDNDDYHTAKEMLDRDSLESVESVETPPITKYSFRDRFDSLKNSFSNTQINQLLQELSDQGLLCLPMEICQEMLTPQKKKGSMVPVPARSKVMVLCDQTEPISFTAALTRPVLNKCKKIGEGVYGEVFRSSNNNQSVAIKIIPIEGDFLVNDEPQKKFDEILPEIVIAKELSDLRFSKKSFTTTFCEVNSVSCVRGKYPAGLLKQWDEYDKARRSENDRPDIFKENQLYIVFEFADCGKALDSHKPDNLLQAKSILSQVTFALAVAEESLQFEHRDLHWGNVLVRPTDVEEIEFRLTGQKFRIPTMGVEASVIDYTLSRLTKDGCRVYSDLSKDDSLFQGKGDYQFDIYRKMKEINGNDWEKFYPHTNVFWLHYLADKLVYRNNTTLSNRGERDILRQFRQFSSQMLDYTSSTEMAVDALFLNS